jgi:HAD superfamily hydrolase (TIGR01509 family)
LTADIDGLAAVLFDMDGLLIDSEPVWYDVECAIVARLGGQWSRDHQAAIAGGLIDKGCAYMLHLTQAEMSVSDLQEELLTAMTDRYGTEIPLHKGVVELIEALAEEDIPMGVVSSSYRVLVDAALAHFPADTFAVTVSGDEVKRGKPHPEPYLEACRRIGADPRRTVVFEDSQTGVASAEAAGCRVVAVPEHAVIEPTPHRLVVASLADIGLAQLEALVAT